MQIEYHVNSGKLCFLGNEASVSISCLTVLKLNRRGHTTHRSSGMDVSVLFSCNSFRNELQTCGKYLYLHHVFNAQSCFLLALSVVDSIRLNI